GHEALRRGEVALDARGGHGLQRGDLHGGPQRRVGSPDDAASASCAFAVARLSTRSTFGSLHGPVTWNSRVPAWASGLRRNTWARKLPRPSAGLITAYASDAVAALISGTTTTRRSCVSWSMSALPSIRTADWTPRMRRLMVRAA